MSLMFTNIRVRFEGVLIQNIFVLPGFKTKLRFESMNSESETGNGEKRNDNSSGSSLIVSMNSVLHVIDGDGKMEIRMERVLLVVKVRSHSYDQSLNLVIHLSDLACSTNFISNSTYTW
ncbi:hypothetical protein BY996DRAFT_6515576 [Phakopsora pachyrhizi]|nr:hypothetical protein BY996DRAFT_6515576 [Phakopsora pachyrhizi]